MMLSRPFVLEPLVESTAGNLLRLQAVSEQLPFRFDAQWYLFIPTEPWNERWKNDLAGVFWLSEEEEYKSEDPGRDGSALGGAGPWAPSTIGVRLPPNESAMPSTSLLCDVSRWRERREARDMLPCHPG